MKKCKKDYDFTGLTYEITGDDLYLINGGKEIGNSYAEQAEAKPGDTVTDSKGVTHELTQGDINWAKQKIAGQDNTSQTTGNAEAANNAGGNHNSENQNQDRDLRVTPANYQDPATDARGYYSTGNYQTATTSQENSSNGRAFEVHTETNSPCESIKGKKKVHGQVTIGFNLNAVAMIGFDASIGLQFNLDDSEKSGMLLSGGFASGTSLGASVFAGYNSGKADAENIGTFSAGYGLVGVNLGMDVEGKLSGSLSFSIPNFGIDSGFNFSKQHSIVLPFATDEEKNRLMEMYYEHH
jgi:hypothetical protein